MKLQTAHAPSRRQPAAARRPGLAAGLALALTLLAAPLWASDLKVPQDFPTIQEALDAAAPGDVVSVGPGVYRERLTLSVEGLTLQGSGASLDAEFGGPCVSIAADSVTLQGFGLLDGGDPAGDSACVSVDGLGVTLRDLRVRAGAGVGLHVTGDGALIEDNDLDGCLGAAISVEADLTTSITTVRRNLIARCGAGVIASRGQLRVSDNRLSDLAGTGLDLDPANFASSGPLAGQVERNRIERVAGLGIDLDTDTGGTVELTRNVVADATLGGIDAQSTGGGDLDVFANRVERCGGDGLRTRGNGPLFVARNRVSATGGRGLFLEVTGSASGLIERNRVADTNGHGLQINGRDLDVLKNRVQRTVGVGLAYSGNTARLRRNQILDAGRQGLLLAGNDGLIERCLVRGAARDGLLLTGLRNDVLDSRFLDNGGDGIDLQELGFQFDDKDNLLRGNRCTGNAHEGIDNSALDTLVEDNVLSGNGGAFGPEIAGAGNDVTGDDVPDGTLASFTGNTIAPGEGAHEPGGATTPQRLDLGEALP